MPNLLIHNDQVNDSLKFIVAVEDDELNVSEIPISVIVADENDNPSTFSQVFPHYVTVGNPVVFS